MDNEKKLNATEKIIKCDNCGSPLIQTEVVENYGFCPNCKEDFKPFNKSGE